MSEIQKAVDSAANNSNAALLLSSIVDSSDDAIISKDLDGVITSWNRSSERLFGYTAKEAIGRTVAALLIPADRQDEEPNILARLRIGERVDPFETVRRRKDGSLLDISLTISPVKDLGGKIIGISKIARDITEQVRARAEIAELAERLRITLTSIGDAVVATDANGAVTYLNPVAEELTGWPLADATGKPLPEVFKIVNEETRNTVENPVSKVLREGRVVGLANHTVLIARSGQEYAIDDSAAPIRDRDGKIVGVVMVFRDITAQRQAEATTRLMASIVESSDDAIIGKDLTGVITTWNRGAERIFGYSAAQAIGKRISMLSVPGKPDDMAEILRRIRAGECVEHFETLRQTKDGSVVNISLTVSPVYDAAGHIIGASKIARDITQQVRARAQIAELAERLRITLGSMGDGVIATDPNGAVTYMNPVAENLTGWPLADATGKPLPEVFRIVNEITRKTVENPVSKVLREGGVVGLGNHTVLIARGGQEYAIDDSAAPIRDGAGNVVGVVMVFRDNTASREAEERLRLAVDAAPNAMIMVGSDGRIELVNAQTRKLFGYEREELIGQPVEMLVPERYRAGHGELRATFQSEPAARPMGAGRDLFGRRQDGTEVPIEIGLNPISTIQGDFVLAAIIDISERMRAEENLRKANGDLLRANEEIRLRVQDYQTLLKAAPALIWTAHDPGCIQITGNTAADVFLSTTAGMNVSQTPKTGTPSIPIRHFGPDGRELDAMELPMQRAALSGRPVENIELEFLKPDGQRAYTVGNAAPLFDASGNVRGSVAVFVDISARKKAEAKLAAAHEELRLSEERLSLMMKYLPVGVGVVNADGHVLIANPVFRKFLDGDIPSVDDMESRKWRGYHADGKLIERQGYPAIRALGGEEVVPGMDFLHTNKDGVENWVRMGAVPFRSPEGEIIGALTLVQDIDNERRAADALRDSAEEVRVSNQELQRANADLNQFAFAASHDLQEPLRMITSYSQLLLKGYRGQLDGEAATCVEFIKAGSKRMRELLADLLAYTQVANDREEMVAPVDLNVVFRAVLENCKAVIDETKATVTSDPLPAIDGGEPHFIQLLQNLISNGLKYRAAGRPPRIHVSAERQNGFWRVAVKDNGIGIAPEYHDQIFGVFKRLHGKDISGTGIGLAICQRVVERYGGKIWVESEADQGATFYLTLPAAEGKGAAAHD